MVEDDAHGRPSRYPIRDAALKGQLLVRREKLRGALPLLQDPSPLHRLLQEVDAALARMEAGTFGLCDTCHESIETERLLADPLCRTCLDHLSAAEQRELEDDLDLAFQVQSGLLPKPGSVADGWTMAYHYRPAGPVSGDYCDLIRLEDGSGLFLLGDVMGKGVAASMLTAHLHAIFRSLSAPARPVWELVTKANRVFCEGTLPSFFATVVCGRLARDGGVEICNAGHCYPLHVHDGAVSPIESTGVPLGVLCDAQFTSSHTRLALGDALVIHTDGLSETINRAGDQYGSERMIEVLRQQRRHSPDHLLAAVLHDLDGFRIGAPVTDDLTVMVIRREGS